MIVSADGQIVEALESSEMRIGWTRYKQTEYHFVKADHVLKATPDRIHVVTFAEGPMS